MAIGVDRTERASFVYSWSGCYWGLPVGREGILARIQVDRTHQSLTIFRLTNQHETQD